ncbi:tetratricopeptide repeat protein [Magnetococcales bacterium HHB-1]
MEQRLVQWIEQGIEAFQKEDLKRAQHLFEKVLNIDKISERALRHLALIALKREQFQEANDLFDRILLNYPDRLDVYNDKGIALAKLKRETEAESCFKRVLAADEKSAAAHLNLGHVHFVRHQFDIAADFYQKALKYRTENDKSELFLAQALKKAGKFKEAITHYKSYLSSAPDHRNDILDAKRGLAATYNYLGQFEMAENLLQDLLLKHPESTKVHNDLAVVLRARKNFPEMEKLLKKTLALNEKDIWARWNLSLLQLSRGEYKEGFKNYQARLNHPDFEGFFTSFDYIPTWQGEDLKGKSILISCEQGFGDSIHFCRYLPLLISKGARVYFILLEELIDFFRFQPSLKKVTFLLRGAAPPKTDFHINLLSLPYLLGTTVETIPADYSYFISDDLHHDFWRQRLEPYQDKIRVGLVWAGNLDNLDAQIRTLKLIDYSPFFEQKSMQFFALQMGPGRGDLEGFQAPDNFLDLGCEIQSFSDTAAIMTQLDLMITCDTVTLHLAGALGVTTWALLPFVSDWRWIIHREDTPWYPSVRLFRQKNRDAWPLLVEKVNRELSRFKDKKQVSKAGARFERVQLFREALQLKKEENLPLAEERLTLFVQLNPRSVEGLLLLAEVLCNQKKSDLAIDYYRRALKYQPDHHQGVLASGSALGDVGNFLSAEKAYRQLLKYDSLYPEAEYRLGMLFFYQKKFSEAGEIFSSVAEKFPGHQDNWLQLSRSLIYQKKYAQLLPLLEEGIKLHPYLLQLRHFCGYALNEMHRHEEALEHFQQILHQEPEKAVHHESVGLALLSLRRFEEAESLLKNAVQKFPDYQKNIINLGFAYEKQGRFACAVRYYTQALLLEPDDPYAQLNLGLVFLMMGEFKEGWPLYESRRRRPDMIKIYPKVDKPLWQGEILRDKVILIYAEQGWGDLFQFIRYLPLLKARGAKILMLVRTEEAHGLLKEMDCIDQLMRSGDKPLEAPDYHSPLLSLPLRFNTTLKTIPDQTPYLKVPEESKQKWMDFFQSSPKDRVRIGLVWAGNSQYAESASRHLSFKQFQPLLDLPGCQFFSLQMGEGRVNNLPEEIIDLADHIDDFSDTAAIISTLDLLISVDTAVVHLAGALACPVWTLLSYIPEWRWSMMGDRTPWYPGMRLFRQSENRSWSEVISSVKAALQIFCEQN